MTSATRTVVHGWTVRPFLANQLCRCGEFGKTFSVHRDEVAQFGLCAACVDRWNTQPLYSHPRGEA